MFTYFSATVYTLKCHHLENILKNHYSAYFIIQQNKSVCLFFQFFHTVQKIYILFIFLLKSKRLLTKTLKKKDSTELYYSLNHVF